MIRHTRLVLLAVFSWWMAAGARPVAAQTPPSGANPPIQAKPIEHLAWFVGGTWTTEEKNDNGATLLVKLTCT